MKRLESKYLISGPAPLGRILNYVKRIKQNQYQTSRRGPRTSNNLDDWTVCFMVGLNLINKPSFSPLLRIRLTPEGSRVYSMIKGFAAFPDHPRKSRTDMLSIKNNLRISYPQLYRRLADILLESDVVRNLTSFLEYKNEEKMRRTSFYRRYGAIFGIKQAGFNRLPSLLQIAEFCDILREEGAIVRVISGVRIQSSFDIVKEHVKETKRKRRQAGETTLEEEDFIADAAKNLSLKKKQVVVTQILRDVNVSSKLKALYGGKCQICGFTFIKKGGGFYSETHHLVPLGKKGSDVISNMVILCPNCHKKLHYAKVRFGRRQNNKFSLRINNSGKTIKYHPKHFRAVKRI